MQAVQGRDLTCLTLCFASCGGCSSLSARQDLESPWQTDLPPGRSVKAFPGSSHWGRWESPLQWVVPSSKYHRYKEGPWKVSVSCLRALAGCGRVSMSLLPLLPFNTDISQSSRLWLTAFSDPLGKSCPSALYWDFWGILLCGQGV